MGKSSTDQNGFRRQEANPVSMVGVFPYTGKQIDYDGEFGLDPKKIYWVLRPAEELFAPEAIKSFNGIPIRIGHVMLGDGFEPVDKEHADGCIFNCRQSMDMPEYLIADFCIYTDKMKKVLEKGKIRELSLGYRCNYIPEEGIFNGTPYQFKQVNLRGNHLALVEKGRCGSSVCVCDNGILTFDSLPEEIEMEQKDKTEKARKLVEAIKNGDDETCSDCLDFYDLTPEQRKAALAFAKEAVEKEKDKATAEDAGVGKKAKDELPPPPPPPPPDEEKKEEEEKKDDAATAAAPAAAPAPAPAPTPAPAAAEPTQAPAPAPAEKAEGEAGGEGNVPAEKAEDCKDKKGKKTMDEKKEAQPEEAETTVVEAAKEPDGVIVEGEKVVEKAEDCKSKAKAKDDDEDGKCKEDADKAAPAAKVEDEDTKKPEEVIVEGEKVVEKAEDCKSKAKVKDEDAKEPEEVVAEGEEVVEKAEDCKSKAKAKDEDEADAKDKEHKDGCACEDCKAKAKAKDCGTGVTEPSISVPVSKIDGTEEKKDADKKAEDCKSKAKAKDEDEDDKCKDGECKDKPKAIAKDEYEAFAAEYSRAQKLAEAVRPLIGQAFDAALMREVDVARHAAKNIKSLAFVADEADAIVLAAVKGHVAAIAAMQEKPADTYKVVEDAAVDTPSPTNLSKDLSAYLNAE